MKRSARTGYFVFSLILALGLLLPTSVSAIDDVRVAVARLQDVNGGLVGSISFTELGSSVVIFTQVSNLPAGFHGFHIHAVGQCDASGETPFASAGAHYDAGTAEHPNHAGDLPSILVMSSGAGTMTVATDRFTVADLLDADGSAVVIHADADQFTADAHNGNSGSRLACGVIQAASSDATSEATLASLQSLPLDLAPAAVSREEGAETGALVMTLHAMNGMQVLSQITSGAAGQIGSMTQEGNTLMFTFTEITYDVAPIQLPGGFSIGAQSIKLDPSQPSTMQVDLNTGAVTRNFHWIMTSTDVLYNGESSIALGDTASAQIAEITDMGNNVFAVRLVTHWKTNLTLDTWSIGGVTLPGGTIDSIAEFDGLYLVDFNQ
jgi:Cu-Zn family superoxide dismutase